MERNDKLKRARKRVEELRGFYIHLAVYVVINLMILGINMYHSYQDGNGLFHWPLLVTPLAWGIGLAFHAAKVYAWNPFFGRKWEEEQIRKYMEADKRDSERFK